MCKQDNWHRSHHRNSLICSHMLEDHCFDCYQCSLNSLLQPVNRIGINSCMEHSQLHRYQNNPSHIYSLVWMDGCFPRKINNLIQMRLCKWHTNSRNLLNSLLNHHQNNQWYKCNLEAILCQRCIIRIKVHNYSILYDDYCNNCMQQISSWHNEVVHPFLN
jgi:hypothetical protein